MSVFGKVTLAALILVIAVISYEALRSFVLAILFAMTCA